MSDELKGNEAARQTKISRLPNEIILLILVSALPFYMFFAGRGESTRGFVAALSVCAVLSVGAILRAYAHQIIFWVTLCGMAILHVLLVVLVPWPPELHGPGIAFAPLVILDMYAWAKLLTAFAGRAAVGP
jgi:hypothetical protein